MQAQQALVGPPPQRSNTMQNTLNNITNPRAPRSPLLGPNGDPWFPPNAQNNGSNQQQQISQVKLHFVANTHLVSDSYLFLVLVSFL